MTDLILQDVGSVNRLIYRTDAVCKLDNSVFTVNENLTIMEVVGLNTAEDILGLGLQEKHTTLATVKAAAAAARYSIQVNPQGDKQLNTPIFIQLGTTAVPVASGVTSSNITVTWGAVPGATGYILERATNAAFSTGLTAVYTGPLLTFANTGLTTATTYYYRVRATYASGTTSSSSTIAGNVLTSGTVTGAIVVGGAVTGTGVAPNTIITGQLTGTAGASGTYTVNNPQTVTTFSGTFGAANVVPGVVGANSPTLVAVTA